MGSFCTCVTKYIFPAQDEDAACECPMLTMKMESLDNFSVVYWSGDESNHDMSIETYKEGRTKTRQLGKILIMIHACMPFHSKMEANEHIFMLQNDTLCLDTYD